MALKVRLHRRARNDLRSIRDYLMETAGSDTAERVRVHLMRRISQLSRLPHMGRASSDSRVRILAPTRYPYRVYYTVLRDEIVVLHIRHTARRAPDDIGSPQG